MKERKYIKPKSLTWWTSIAAIASGLAMLVHGVRSLGLIGDLLTVGWGCTAPFSLIWMGLMGIGLRGAIGKIL